MSSFQIFLFACVLLCSPIFTNSQPYDYPTANLSTSWINSVSNHSIFFNDRSRVMAILKRGTHGQGHGFGFYCNGDCETYILAIFVLDLVSFSNVQVVWSANPNNPVRKNSTLQLTRDGDLVLKDVDGTLAWSTNTARRSIAGLNLTEMGNLVMFDQNGDVVWQSFDYPTDCLVPGQRLKVGQKLTASVSSSNWTQGGIHLSATDWGLNAYIDSNPPQVYFTYSFQGNDELSYVSLTNGSLAFYTNSTRLTSPSDKIDISRTTTAQYMKLDYDGHLKVFEWQGKWTLLADITALYLGECDYPMVCGENGICSSGQCRCPTSIVDPINYFKQIDSRHPNLGCSPVTPLTCDVANHHKFLDLDQVTYFNFDADMNHANIDRCKEACLKNCSCKAIIFQYANNASDGNCYFASQIFSLMNNDNRRTHYNYTVSIKVPVPQSPKGEKNRLAPVLISAIGTLVLAIGIGISVFMIRKKRKALRVEVEEDYLYIRASPSQ